MNRRIASGASLFHIGIVRYRDWRPESWRDVPNRDVVLHSALEGCFSARRAAAFIRGFNQTALARGVRLWAICQPVRLCYEGEFDAGEP
jgi:hypothetical protein